MVRHSREEKQTQDEVAGCWGQEGVRVDGMVMECIAEGDTWAKTQSRRGKIAAMGRERSQQPVQRAVRPSNSSPRPGPLRGKVAL